MIQSDIKFLEDSLTRHSILRIRLGWLIQSAELGMLPLEGLIKKVKELLICHQDDSRCNHTSKFLYYCDKEKGHEGFHQEGILRWKD